MLFEFQQSQGSNTIIISTHFQEYGVDAGATRCAAAINSTTQMFDNCHVTQTGQTLTKLEIYLDYET